MDLGLVEPFLTKAEHAHKKQANRTGNSLMSSIAVLSGFPATEVSKLQPGIKPDSPKPESCALTIRNPLLT